MAKFSNFSSVSWPAKDCGRKQSSFATAIFHWWGNSIGAIALRLTLPPWNPRSARAAGGGCSQISAMAVRWPLGSLRRLLNRLLSLLRKAGGFRDCVSLAVVILGNPPMEASKQANNTALRTTPKTPLGTPVSPVKFRPRR